MNTLSTAAYRENRGKFPESELRKYDGKWVAFSSDGRCIVASESSIAALSNLVRAANMDLQEVVLEHIENEASEIQLGGAESL